MKKLLVCLLFALALLVPAEEQAYAAAEEKIYSEYIDEVAGMEEPYWCFNFYPEVEYRFNLFGWEFGYTGKYKAWDIESLSYYFTLNNEHKGEYLIGYNSSDLDITFNYVYSSVDDNYKYYTSTAAFTYPLSDSELKTDFVEFEFLYEDILAGCQYYLDGCDTVISSVEISISSQIFNTHGSIVRYEFSTEQNYAKQIYTGIDYYVVTNSDKLCVSNQAKIIVAPHDDYENSSGLHGFVVVYPDSIQEAVIELDEFITNIAFKLPGAVLDVAEFLGKFLLNLPDYICMVVPFLPEYVVKGVMYCIIFGFACKLLGGAVKSLTESLSKKKVS